MNNDYLIHYRTPGSKNGVRLYQYKDGRLTPAGKRRYLDGGIKGSKVSKEYEEELEFNSQQNIYPPGFDTSSKPKSKPKKVRPNSKADSIDKKMSNYSGRDPNDYVGPNGYRRVEGEIPFKIRAPYFRDDNEKLRKNIFRKIGKQAEKIWTNIKDKTQAVLSKHVGDYFDKSFGKHFAYQVVPPKGSDGINHLIPYTNKEASEALGSYINSVSTGSIGSYINTFIQTTQMNIANGCARFLDSIGLDDEVNSFLKKLGIKDNNDMIEEFNKIKY